MVRKFLQDEHPVFMADNDQRSFPLPLSAVCTFALRVHAAATITSAPITEAPSGGFR